MHVVTIGARNYLSRVRALARSFREHHPDDRFSVLLVDAAIGEIPSTPWCRTITPSELPLAEDEFRRMALLYDIAELSTALKPWALEMLLDEGEQTVVYLDPDILVYDRLDEIDRLAQEHGIVVTPHRESPMPRDGLRPSEADLMVAGTFNLGFLGVSAAARPMLLWWQQRLARQCYFRPNSMLFVDQRWIDLVPAMWDYAVLRDPGYNVAYWNVDARELRRDGGRVTVNGSPLRFFHFSGYSPDRPWLFTKYVADRPRVTLDSDPILRDLCTDYGRLIGTDIDTTTPYRWSRLNNGVGVTPHLRELFRRGVEAEEKGTGDPVPAPFSGNDEQIVDWFRSPVVDGGLVNCFLLDVWQGRGDLQRAFPDPTGNDEPTFVQWAWSNVGRDLDLDIAWLLPDIPGQRANATHLVTTPGVNLAGYLSSELGLGQAGRLLAGALRESGLPYGTHDTRATRSRKNASYAESSTSTRYPVTVSVVTADRFPGWVKERGSDLCAHQHVIGVWAWETEDLVHADLGLPLVDEIWTISDYTQRVIKKITDKPVHVVPLPVVEPSPTQKRAVVGITTAERPYLLFAFDFFSVVERKNAVGLVQAFRRAFPSGDGPMLVIKTINGGSCKTARSRLAAAAAAADVGADDIRIVDHYLDHSDVGSLMAGATAYVSLHRAEGFGLTMAESMARGVPVIATGYSGNLDFMSDDNSVLVPYRRVRVGAEGHPYPAESYWAEPDLDAAADAMRWVVDNPEAAAALGHRGRESVLRSHNIDRTVSFLRRRIRAVTGAHDDEIIDGLLSSITEYREPTETFEDVSV